MISSKCYEIFGALIGLTGALSNNGKGQDTDALVRKALILAGSPDGDQKKTKEMLAAIRAEKFRISPDCAVCQAPCGNTSDYDMADFEKSPDRVKAFKEEIVELLCEKAAAQDTLPEITFKALTYLKYDLKDQTYKDLIEELKQ